MTALALALGAPQQGGQSILPMLLMWGMIILIFWLLLLRPQRQAQKRHQEMLANLKRGDEVMTDGGIIGEIVHLKDDRVTIRTGDTRVVVARPKIARVLGQAASELKETS